MNLHIPSRVIDLPLSYWRVRNRHWF